MTAPSEPPGTGIMPRSWPPNQDTHCWHPIDGPSARVSLGDPPSGGTDAVRCCWCPSRAVQHWQRVTGQREGHGPNARVPVRRITATVFTEHPVRCLQSVIEQERAKVAAAKVSTRTTTWRDIIRGLLQLLGFGIPAGTTASLFAYAIDHGAGHMTQGELLMVFWPEILGILCSIFVGGVMFAVLGTHKRDVETITREKASL